MTVLCWRRLPALGAGFLMLACGGGGGGGMAPCSPGPATQLAKSTGDPPPGFVNNPLPTPLSVTARDASSCAVPGVVVNWAVASGGGGVNPAQSTTNGAGVATTTDSIGSTSPQTVTATPTIALPTVTFNVTGSAPPTAAAVNVRDDFYDKASVVVQVNGTVTWTWAGADAHTVSFDGGVESGSPPGIPQTSGTYQRAFTSVGTFGYFCRVHSNMNGTVRVVH